MKKIWIYNFDKILQNHKDVSDYERFYLAYKNYIKENEGEHQEILNVLLKALLIFKSTTLLSITYRLMSELNVNIKIEENILKEHFKNRSLRRYLFPIFTLTNTQISSKKLIKLLYDDKYEDEYFFKYIGDRKDLLSDFLLKDDPNLIRKQLLAILYTGYYTNMDYYIKIIGSKNKHIAFLAYEVFSMMIIENVEIQSNLFKIVKKEFTYIEIIDNFEVESLENFLIYFLCFMKDKVLIYNMIKGNMTKEIELILRDNYVISNFPVKISRNLNLYSTDIKIFKMSLTI